MHRSNHHLLRRVDTLSLPFTGSVVPGASRFMLRSPQESEWEYRRGPGDENDASTVKRIIKCWLQLRVCSCSVKGSQLMFKRLCKLTTIASYGPSHPSYEEESESENGMKGESNAFRRESSDNSRENEPKERETGNAFSTYGFSRGPLGVLRNQVCQRKTMTLSLNMLPMNKESHSICHLFPRLRSKKLYIKDQAVYRGYEVTQLQGLKEAQLQGIGCEIARALARARGATLLSLAGSECDRSDSLVVSQIQLVFCPSKAKIPFVVAELEESKAFIVHRIKKALAQALPS
ncbi:hypothetical protein V6N12_013742 [Hibiscus sabdariffa]|uniref:Uncharacterized protein n=1 Tax=Hibiscus sabdariffa TaxID=183260 RepID=A0ABR2CV33_9ROSI